MMPAHLSAGIVRTMTNAWSGIAAQRQAGDTSQGSAAPGAAPGTGPATGEDDVVDAEFEET
jgi:hypothetical protein